MDGINDLFRDKRQHYHYLEKLFKKVSQVFLQLAEMVTDLEDTFGALEDDCVLKRAECIYKRCKKVKFDRKKALPFAMFVKDAAEIYRKEHPSHDIVECINALKTSWDDPFYRPVREMYEYVADEELEEPQGMKKNPASKNQVA